MKARAFIVVLFVFLLGLTTPVVGRTNVAEQTEFTGTETFDPFGLLGPPLGAFLEPGRLTCPGAEPTGDPTQPCPPGVRIDLRGASHLTRLVTNDPRVIGWATVEDNNNWDATGAGPEWGKLSLAVDGGGRWEGRWNSLRTFEGDHWNHELHGTMRGVEGPVEGLNLEFEDHIVTYSLVPFYSLGTVEGRVIDPHAN